MRSRRAARADPTIDRAHERRSAQGRPGASLRRASAWALTLMLTAACAAATPASAPSDPAQPSRSLPATGLGALPGDSDARHGDPTLAMAAGGPWVMPASQLNTANIAWLATDPPDPPPTPVPSPTPTPAPTPKAGAPIPPGAWHVPVLMYHLITAPAPPDALAGLVVSPTLFDAHMHALKDAGWTTITAAQLSAALTAGTKPAPRTVVVTFDDGYADGWQNAMPILQRYGFVGTFYIITDRIDIAPFLSSDMVRALHAAGMEVANHTRQHVDLSAQSYANAFSQVSGASDTIARLTGVRPTTLAYPYGSVNSTAVKAAADAGITFATTTVDDCVEYPANRLVAPRIRVSPGHSAAALVSMLKACVNP